MPQRLSERFARKAAALLALLVLSGWAPAARAASESPSKAPELPTDGVLATLIEQSLAVRPELVQAQAAVQAERERVPQVKALPDPRLQLGVQNDSFTSWEVGKMAGSFYQIMGSQTLPLPAKRRLRGEIVALGADQAEQSVERVRLSTEAEVRRAYLDLLLARERLALLDRLEALWQKSSTLARSRYETVGGSQTDVLRAQLELSRIKQRRWGLEADVATQLQTLNRLRAHPLGEPIETTTRLMDLAVPALGEPDAAVKDALARSPELAAARVGVTQAQRSTDLARKLSVPDLTVNGAVMPRGGEFTTMWQVSVAATVPIFSRNTQKHAVAEGKARALASESDTRTLEQVLRLRVEQRRTVLEAVLQAIALYQNGLLIQSEATAESALAQYQVGKLSFVSVLEAIAGFIADQEGYLQALAQAHRLQIESAEVSLAPVSSSGAGMGNAAMPGAGPLSNGASVPSSSPAAPGTGGGSSSSMSSM